MKQETKKKYIRQLLTAGEWIFWDDLIEEFVEALPFDLILKFVNEAWEVSVESAPERRCVHFCVRCLEAIEAVS